MRHMDGGFGFAEAGYGGDGERRQILPCSSKVVRRQFERDRARGRQQVCVFQRDGEMQGRAAVGIKRFGFHLHVVDRDGAGGAQVNAAPDAHVEGCIALRGKRIPGHINKVRRPFELGQVAGISHAEVAVHVLKQAAAFGHPGMGDDNGQNIVCAVVKFVCDVEGEGSECALVRPEELAVEPDGNEIIRAVEGEFIHGAGNFGAGVEVFAVPPFMRIDCDQFLGFEPAIDTGKAGLELRIAGNGDGLEGAVVEVRFLGPGLDARIEVKGAHAPVAAIEQHIGGGRDRLGRVRGLAGVCR